MNEFSEELWEKVPTLNGTVTYFVDYIGIHLQQNINFLIMLDKNLHISIIPLSPLSPEQSRQRHRALSKEENTLIKGASNWKLEGN